MRSHQRQSCRKRRLSKHAWMVKTSNKMRIRPEEKSRSAENQETGHSTVKTQYLSLSLSLSLSPLPLSLTYSPHNILSFFISLYCPCIHTFVHLHTLSFLFHNCSLPFIFFPSISPPLQRFISFFLLSLPFSSPSYLFHTLSLPFSLSWTLPFPFYTLSTLQLHKTHSVYPLSHHTISLPFSLLTLPNSVQH